MKFMSTGSCNPKSAALIVLTILMAAALHAEGVKTKTLTLTGGGKMFLLKEIGGVVVQSDDSIKVEMVMPSDARTESYKSVDIQEGDVIKMANAKKVTSVEMLEKLYNDLKIGDELKLGIIRDKRMVMASLTKADPEKLPGKMMIMGAPGGEIETGLIDAGLLLKKGETGFIVEEIIDNMLAEFEGDAPQKGDTLLTIQGF